MPLKPQLSISDLLFFEACPYSYMVRQQAQAWSAPGPALRLGTQLHKYMEWHRSGRSGPQPPLTEPGLAGLIEAAQPDLVEIPYTNIHTELQLQVDMGSWTLCCTPDDISFTEEGLWSLQWKSLAPGLAPGMQARHVAFSPHEITYAFALSELHSTELLGTAVGVFRKLSAVRIAAGEPVFSLQPVRRSTAEAKQLFVSHVLPRFQRMVEATTGGAAALAVGGTSCVRRYEACLGPFRNSPCPAYNHCHYGLDIDGLSLPEPLRERYARDAAAAH